MWGGAEISFGFLNTDRRQRVRTIQILMVSFLDMMPLPVPVDSLLSMWHTTQHPYKHIRMNVLFIDTISSCRSCKWAEAPSLSPPPPPLLGDILYHTGRLVTGYYHQSSFVTLVLLIGDLRHASPIFTSPMLYIPRFSRAPRTATIDRRLGC
jgi:hypothetical protein